MNLHDLHNVPGARKPRKRVGRGDGSGHGGTSGKGHKGQRARAGHNRKPNFEGGQMRLVNKIPIRGFSNINRRDYLVVNVSALERFETGTEVTPELLKASGMADGPAFGLKILGEGILAKKLTVKAHAFSASARQKIEAAGGNCVTL
jgi:large subunit ribosomal protein L15